MAYTTSLASRRSSLVGGEHIHRLFSIPVKRIYAKDLAKEAFGRINNNLKRRYFLERLQILIIEEASLIHAELMATVDLILQMVKLNDLPFGGVLIISNGDCCQLPNVSGRDIFQSCSLIFSFNFHFLNELVRMTDEKGQEVLKLLEERPVPPESIERICTLLSENCNFHQSWDNVDREQIMKVFGKRCAERQSLQEHRAFIEQSGERFSISKADDEMCVNKSNIWRPADPEATKILNKDNREPENLLLYPQAVLRLTRNLDNSSQGDLFVLDYENSNEASLSLFKAPSPDAITKKCLKDEEFKNWTKIIVQKTAGFIIPTSDGSIRRVQFPCCNYIALTVHKLMGDTFHSLATAISSSESMYSLWLTSQIYVIVSRVRRLSSLHFVGSIRQTMEAIRMVLSATHLQEERIYKFMKRLRQQHCQKSLINVPCTLYLRNHFEVPATENGFVFLLVSMTDHSYTTFHLAETSISLSAALRDCNSTRDSNLIEKQPWAMGFFIWKFSSSFVRKQCLDTLNSFLSENVVDFPTLCSSVETILSVNFQQLCLCITGHVVCNTSSF